MKMHAISVTVPSVDEPYTTKWSVLQARRAALAAALDDIEKQIEGLRNTPCGLSCDCGETFRTEADFARHFYIFNTMHLNLGNCPVKDGLTTSS